MPIPDPTVSDWIAQGEETVEVHCSPKDRAGCGHYAVIRLDSLPPEMTRSQLARQVICSACGGRGGQPMRDMGAHYRRLHDETGWDCVPSPARVERG